MSRHCVSAYSSVTARPPSARPRYSDCGSGFRKRSATAARTRTTPSQPRSPSARFTSAPPPLAVDRLERQEQRERNETQIENDVLGVDDPLAEIIEVLG